MDTEVGPETRPDNIHVVWIEGKVDLNPGSFPIGTVLAWVPITSDAGAKILPSGWVECNGERDGVPY